MDGVDVSSFWEEVEPRRVWRGEVVAESLVRWMWLQYLVFLADVK